MLKRDEKIKKAIACSQVIFLLGMISNVPISTEATVEQSKSIENYNVTFNILDSSRKNVNASITINNKNDEHEIIEGYKDTDGKVTYNLDKNKQYKYTVTSNGYKKSEGELTISGNTQEFEIHMIKNDENMEIPSAPRINGYSLNENNEKVNYESGTESLDTINVSVDNSYADAKIKGYKIITKETNKYIEPTEEEWNNSPIQIGDETDTINGCSMKIEFNAENAGNRRIYARAVSDKEILGLVSTFDVNIKDKFASLYIDNNLVDSNYDDNIWLNKIPNIRIEKGNNPKYITKYILSDKNGIIAENNIDGSSDIKIDKDGQYILSIITLDGTNEINKEEKKINIETKCMQPEVLAKVIKNTDNLVDYVQNTWTNEDILVQASLPEASSGIKGYKVISKNEGEGEPTNEDWNAIDDSKLVNCDSEKNITDLIKVSQDFNGAIYVKAVSNADTESDYASINVKVKKTKPSKPEVTINGLNQLGWYTNEIKNSDIEIKNTATDINLKTFVKVWNKNSEHEPENGIDVSDGNYDNIISKLSEDGSYKIIAWTEDEAGNKSEQWPEDSKEKEININKYKPVTYSIKYMTSPISGVSIYDIYRDVSTVRIYTSNDFSGIKSIIPKINNNIDSSNISNYNNLQVQIDENNNCYVEFQIKSQFIGNILVDSIEDNAGNKSNVNDLIDASKSCIVDSAKPTSPIISSKQQDKITNINSDYESGVWVNNDVTLSVSGSSALSGIDHYEYLIKDNNKEKLTESDWDNAQFIGQDQLKSEDIVDNKGSEIKLDEITSDTNKIYYVRAVSRAGIKGEVSSVVVKVKKSKPEAPSVSIKNPNTYGWYTDKLTANDILYSNNKTDIGIKTYAKVWNAVTENENSSEPILISIDNSDSNKGEYKNITDDVLNKIKDEGKYKIKFYAVDEAGNYSSSWPENSDGYSVNIDYSKPDNLGIEYMSSIVSGVNGYDIFNNNCVVRIYSKDDISGIRQINYHMQDEYTSKSVVVNGNVKEEGNKQYVEFTIEPQYRGKIILDSIINNAGLETVINSSNSISSESNNIKNIIIDNKKPSKPLITSGNYINNSWTRDNVSLKIEGSKALSGIKNYRYIVNNGENPSETDWNNSSVLNGNYQNNSRLTSHENLVGEISNLNCDMNKTYWVRAESNAGILGEISSYNVKIQKSAPRNTSIEFDKPNEEGFYKNSPYIKINNIEPLERQAPIYIHYKLWNKTAGETEDSASEVIFNGSNMPSITSDGEYTLRVWTVDEVGNRSSSSSDIVRDFNLDSTMPVITLDYDNNNALNDRYYNKTRNATITVNDINFNPDKVNIKVTSAESGNEVQMSGNSWSSDGISHSTTIPFDSDGDYKIEASCTDKADNTSNNIDDNDFVIDTTSPTLEITNVQDLSANNSDVSPLIQFNDTNIDFSNVEYTISGLINGVLSKNVIESTDASGKNISIESIDKDDNYVLLAKATDKAGNSVDKQVAFSVNKNGSTFEYLNNNISGGYVTESFKPEIKVNNIDEVTILSLTLNGKQVKYTYEDGIVQFNDEVDTDGKYIINMDVKDAAGNTNSMEPVEFILDKSKPKVLIDGVEDGKTYNSKVQITVSKDNSYDKFDSIELNGKNMLQEGNTNPDGSVTFEVSDYDNYNLKVKASDDAGNITSEDIKFKISKNIFASIPVKYIVLAVAAALAFIFAIAYYVLKCNRRN